MDVTVELAAPCGPDELFAWVEDLGRYPQLLEIVARAVPVEPHPDDPGPAWSVDLRGQFGPFARSKRLRMVRTIHEPPDQVRFERVEHDGRDHSPWVLTATVSRQGSGLADGGTLGSGPADGGSNPATGDPTSRASAPAAGDAGSVPDEPASVLTMQLHYGGFLGGPLVEKLLADEIERSRPRLYAAVTGTPTPTPASSPEP